MNNVIDATKLVLLKHQFGRIDKRMKIDAVRWPFHDILWIHQGSIRLDFPELETGLTLDAPNGVLILPGTLCHGQTTGPFAVASVCHFECTGVGDLDFMSPGYQITRTSERIHLQNLVRLAMDLARRNDKGDLGRRKRLLRSILDGFEYSEHRDSPKLANTDERLAIAWDLAAENLRKMRTLSDVAALIGINESGFRTRHRGVWKTSAGEHLRDLRLRRAEELLATTGFNLSEIAQQIGYGHAETFSTSFRKSRGLTPGEYRRWSKPFA